MRHRVRVDQNHRHRRHQHPNPLYEPINPKRRRVFFNPVEPFIPSVFMHPRDEKRAQAHRPRQQRRRRQRRARFPVRARKRGNRDRGKRPGPAQIVILFRFHRARYRPTDELDAKINNRSRADYPRHGHHVCCC